MRFFAGMHLPRCHVNTTLSNTIFSREYQRFACWLKMFFWIRVAKSMLSVHLVLEICGLKVVVSFNFAPSAPHVKRRVKSCEPRAAAATDGHIRFFSFWTLSATWFRQRNSSLLSNFSFKFHVHVLCGCRQKPNDFQLCRFQNGCLVILNNAQLQSTHCPLLPSPMGRGYPSRSLTYNF